MRIFLLAFTLTFFTISLIAQQEVELTTESKPMSMGTNQAFTFAIKGAKLKDIETLWGKYVSRNTKSKVTNVRGEWMILGATERNLSPLPFNIYTTFLATTEDVRISSFFSEGDSNQVFISKESSAEDKILAIEKYLTDFHNLAKRNMIEQELEVEKKGLKALESDLKSMEKDFDKSNKSVSEAKRKIEKNEAEIRRIDREVEMKNSQILQQKNAIINMTTLGDAKKVAEKDLKKFESEKKKLQSDKEKLSKEIDKCKIEIRNEERNIEKLNTTKALKQSDVSKQEEKVKSIEDRLNAVPNPNIKL